MWMPVDAGSSGESFGRLFQWLLTNADNWVTFVIHRDGRVVGSSSFMEIRPEHRRLEIGFTWYARSEWRSGANVDAKLQMLEHAFERLEQRRVEFKTDARNERSRNAILRIGARFDGVIRAHRPASDGAIRDTAAFSILDHEWPMVKQQLHSRLNS